MHCVAGIVLGPSSLSYFPPLASKSRECDGLVSESKGEKEGRKSILVQFRSDMCTSQIIAS